jgi:hypothetical protein
MHGGRFSSFPSLPAAVNTADKTDEPTGSTHARTPPPHRPATMSWLLLSWACELLWRGPRGRRRRGGGGSPAGEEEEKKRSHPQQHNNNKQPAVWAEELKKQPPRRSHPARQRRSAAPPGLALFGWLTGSDTQTGTNKKKGTRSGSGGGRQGELAQAGSELLQRTLPK